jgi:uncharacterized protein (TIGR02996 family)
MNDPLLRSFLDDIKTHPRALAPRLILADWLDDHAATDADRARAELLRIEARQACLESVELTERARAIRDAHLATWLGPLGKVRGLRANVYRGLIQLSGSVETLLLLALRETTDAPEWDWVERLTVTSEGARYPRIWQMPYLRHVAEVIVPTGRLQTAEGMALFLSAPHLDGLNTLNLAHLPPDSAAIRLLAESPLLGQLRTLWLGSAHTEEHLRCLLDSPHFRGLGLLGIGSVSLEQNGLRGVLDHPRLAGLRSLIAYACRLDARSADVLSDPICAGSLEELYLHSNALGDDGIAALARAPFAKLRNLNLSDNQMEAGGAVALAAAAWQGQLESLQMSDNAPGEGAGALLGVPRPRLHTLYVRECHLRSDQLRTLLAYPAPALLSLDLARNPLGPEAAEDLTAWTGATILEQLHLSTTGQRDHGAEVFAAWPDLGKLRQLDLRTNEITERGVQALIDSPHRSPRTVLYLAGNSPSSNQSANVRGSGMGIYL